MIQFDMSGKVALVTGGTSGIGKATAQAFINAGAQVVIVGRDLAKGRMAVDELTKDLQAATFIQADMGNKADLKRLFDQLYDEYDRLDFAINNAAGGGGIGKELQQFEEADFDWAINVNLKGIWWCMKYEIEQMLKQPTGGAIINVASVNGLGGVMGGSIYAASKAGVIALTKSAALELAKTQVRANVLVPGFVDTPSLQQSMDLQSNYDPDALAGVRRQYESFVPQGRITTSNEAANAILWMCSLKASSLVGHSLILDGGMTAWFR